MITVRLIQPSPSHNYYFVVVVVRKLKLYCHSIFQGHQAVLLTMVTTLYIRSGELIHFIAASLYLLTDTSPFPPPLSPWQPTFYPHFLCA